MAGAIIAAWLADRMLGDPARFHPVAGFGRAAGALEQRIWRQSRRLGAVYALSLVGAVAAAVAAAESLTRKGPWPTRAIVRVVVVWATLGGRSLERSALRLAELVEHGELGPARALAPTLVGRDPSSLDGPELCRAAVESVAENTTDAVVAPLLWAALLGAPAAGAYRAANTLDSMVGHRTLRHLRFGWAAARLDDAASWPGARLAVILASLAAPVVGGCRASAWRTAFEDGSLHPSPNAGLIEGAFAGALSVRLGGVNRYGHGEERRPTLGRGEPPGVGDVSRAVRLARAVGCSAALVCAILARVGRNS